jgi:soluble lytic murein transglycosylase-like protein
MTNIQHFVSELKVKNLQVYNWLVAKGIDLSSLPKNASSFVAAATFLLSLPQNSPLPPLDTPIPAVITHFDPIKPPTSESAKAELIRSQYGQIIRAKAAEYNIEESLIFATIMIESGGNPRAIRHEPRINDASYGLGQILYRTAQGIGYKGTPEGLYDPETNIDLIARYHRRNLDHYGHLTAQQLTTAYNTGSPYKKPYPGHITKFNKWYNHLDKLELDLS